jgi:hypothetical protein
MADGDYGMECVIKGLGSAVNDAVKRALADQDIPTDAYVEEMIASSLEDYKPDEQIIGEIVEDWMNSYDFSENYDLERMIACEAERWADDNITDYIRDFMDSDGTNVRDLADDLSNLGGAMDTFAERMNSTNWEIAALHEQIDYLHNRIAELATPWYTKMWNCAVSAWSSAYSYVKGIF